MANPMIESLPDIDPSQRYDLYCAEFGLRVMVYRNVLIKGRRRLPSPQKHDFQSYVELEDAQGNVFFISSTLILKICFPGVEIAGEEVYARH